jgi:GNAT superfamily N-acetyltransferase
MNVVGEIKWFLGDDYAHLKFSESKTSFSIDVVMVPSAHRGNGIGTALIRHILCLADCMGKDVYVSARPLVQYSEEKLARLIVYYERLGFEITDRGLTTAYMRKRHSVRSDNDHTIDG